MSIDLHNRRAIVTGAASGFGKAVTHELLRSGATVVATDVDTDGLTRLTDEATLMPCAPSGSMLAMQPLGQRSSLMRAHLTSPS